MKFKDTIIAQCTPYGYGSIGIIRISGNKTLLITKKILGKIPKPRYANYLSFLKINNLILDKGIAILFLKPNSFTGEDVLELHCHGSPLILENLLNNIIYLFNIRLSEPGEFSKRAFLNNKIDLIQAESIIDLIKSSSLKESEIALNLLKGFLSKKIKKFIKITIKIISNIEAKINFPDENLKIYKKFKIINKIKYLINDLNLIFKKSKIKNLIYNKYKIVITGPRNVGKSSLFNKLIKKNSAIVSDIKGTTRDVIKKKINIESIPLNILDTAGLKIESKNKIEIIGIKKTWKEIKKANHIFFLLDISKENHKNKKIDFWLKKIKKLNNCLLTIIYNKIDIVNEKSIIKKIKKNKYLLKISIKKNIGIDLLINHIIKKIKNLKEVSEYTVLAKQRHLELIKLSIKHLKKGLFIYIKKNYIEILLEELNITLKYLYNILGKKVNNDIIDKIFSNFCIGK